MSNEIKNRFTGATISTGAKLLDAIKNARADLSGADLSGANLSRADLSRADLSWADLSRADLSWADLSWADLSGANLSGADLSRADLSRADLSWANLSGADLSRANLSGANLSWANLSGANLSWANLSGADLSGAEKLSFARFPSIKMLASLNLGTLSDLLTLELMRRDAAAHPNPELFDVWAKDGGCPYAGNIDQFWIFSVNKKLWRPGPPEMADRDLIVLICKEKGWEIKFLS